jgi:hypothetical protein
MSTSSVLETYIAFLTDLLYTVNITPLIKKRKTFEQFRTHATPKNSVPFASNFANLESSPCYVLLVRHGLSEPIQGGRISSVRLETIDKI